MFWLSKYDTVAQNNLPRPCFRPISMSNRSQFFLLPLSETRPPSGASVLIALLVSLYSPFAWIFIEAGPWDQKRWSLLKSLPALPGLFVRSIGILSESPAPVSYVAMGTATLALFLLFFRLGRQSRTALVLAFLGLIATSGWNSWLAFQSFHGT